MTDATPIKGHWWAAEYDASGRPLVVEARVHRVLAYDGAGELVASSKPMRLSVCSCERCGLVSVSWWHRDRETGHESMMRAYGVDVDSLAVMGSAPRCDAFAFARDPSEARRVNVSAA